MRCDSSNGYTGWKALDANNSLAQLHGVTWVDPDALEYAQVATVPGGWTCETVTKASRIVEDTLAKSFFIWPLAITSTGFLSKAAAADAPQACCSACCQNETCRRIGWCAQYRKNLGDVSPP